MALGVIQAFGYFGSCISQFLFVFLNEMGFNAGPITFCSFCVLNAILSLFLKVDTYQRPLDSGEEDENENYKNKVFLLEQIIYKKNNIITSLKEKISKIKDNSMYEKELYIIDPSKAVVEINDELLLYKKIYNKLIKAIQKSRISKARYETMVEELQRENTKLKRKGLT